MHPAKPKRFFNGKHSKKFHAIKDVAFRKLAMIHAAHVLEDLRIPPGNCLEALKADRAGQYSIRINGQLRICFEWRAGNAYNVEIVDYH